MIALPCQAVCCAARIRPGKFMCQPHWFALPAPLRAQINTLWRARQRGAASGIRANAGAILAHVEACDEARRWTAEGEHLLEFYYPDAARLGRLYAARDER